jgi:hypothetical protein
MVAKGELELFIFKCSRRRNGAQQAMIHPPMSVMHAIYVQGISVSAAIVNLFPVKRRIFGRKKRKSPYGIRFFLDPNPNQQGLHT